MFSQRPTPAMTTAHPTIALLTDFGDKDGFVGVMKGVIHTVVYHAGLTTPLSICDIAHHVAPQEVRAAQWILKNTVAYYPPGTIFVAVVDPQVGSTAQKPLLLQLPNRHQFFIAPDNGLLTPVLALAQNAQDSSEEALIYHIDAPDFYTPALLAKTGEDLPSTHSQTFHGRDIYAPIAAHLAVALIRNTLPEFLTQIGAPLLPPAKVVCLFNEEPTRSETPTALLLKGQIDYSDTYGNLITNIPNQWFPPHASATLHLANREWFAKHQACYADGTALTASESAPIMIVPGSCGCLELAIYCGSAQARCQASLGDAITLIVELV